MIEAKYREKGRAIVQDPSLNSVQGSIVVVIVFKKNHIAYSLFMITCLGP